MKGFFAFFGVRSSVALGALPFLARAGCWAAMRGRGCAFCAWVGSWCGRGAFVALRASFEGDLSVSRCTNDCHRLAGFLAHDVELFSGKRIFFGIVAF